MNRYIGNIKNGDEHIMRVIAIVERGDDGKFTAYSEEPCASASGDTKEDALANLSLAISALLADEEYGNEIRASAQRREVVELEVV